MTSAASRDPSGPRLSTASFVATVVLGMSGVFAANFLSQLVVGAESHFDLMFVTTGVFCAGFSFLADHRRWWFAGFLATAVIMTRLHRHGAEIGSIFALCDLLEGFTTCFLIHHFLRTQPDLARVRDVLVIVGPGAAGVSAVFATITAAYSATFLGLSFADSWNSHWLSHAFGFLIIFSWYAASRTETANVQKTRTKPSEPWLLTLSATFVMVLVFGFTDPGISLTHHLSFLTLPFLVWGGLRFGPRAVVLLGVWMSDLALLGTRLGRGPFAATLSNPEALLDCQGFLLAAIGGALVPAAALAERRGLEVSRRRLAVEREALLSRLESTILSLPVGFLTTDEDFRFTSWNPAAEQLFGFTNEEALGKHPFETMVPAPAQPDVAKVFERVRRGERFPHSINQNSTKDGRIILCSWSNMPIHDAQGRFIGMVSMCQDETERRHREEAEGQSRKMESIGRLAGGVAHDFNNLLTIILGNADLAGEVIPAHRELAEHLASIREAGERGAALTAQLLAFARKSVNRPQVVWADAVVTGLRRMLSRLIGENIELAAELESDLWPVRIDRSQLEQVLVNLAVNARDAMPSGGRLTIVARNVPSSVAATSLTFGVSAGDYVKITVADNGIGMSDDVRRHAFEPFYTTKPEGKGTGLGLATCFGIIRQAGGSITVDTSLGIGSSFHILLPRCHPDPPAADQQSNVATRHGENARILIVEDEPLVRELLQETLTRLGHHVETSKNGEDALSKFLSRAEDFDLLITDVVMPKLGGYELAQQFLNRKPALPIVFISGYTKDENPAQLLSGARVRFLQKPFAPDVLARLVQEILDRKTPIRNGSMTREN